MATMGRELREIIMSDVIFQFYARRKDFQEKIISLHWDQILSTLMEWKK